MKLKRRVVANSNIDHPIQWLGLLCAFVAGLAFSLLFPRKGGSQPPPPAALMLKAYTPTGIDLAWESCAKFVDSQLQSIERLDVKLGIVIAGLVSAAGVFFDRAHGILPAILGCISLVALIFAVLGFLQGHYRDSPDPRDVVNAINNEARLTKAAMLGGFVTSIQGNQLAIYRKGLYLNIAALMIVGVVVIATFAKAYSEVNFHTFTNVKRDAPRAAARQRTGSKTLILRSSRIGHPSSNKH